MTDAKIATQRRRSNPEARNELQSSKRDKRRRRESPVADVGELRRALAVCAVDRPVKIRLPDGREFPVADVRLDRDFEPIEDASVLLIAGNDETPADETANQ